MIISEYDYNELIAMKKLAHRLGGEYEDGNDVFTVQQIEDEIRNKSKEIEEIEEKKSYKVDMDDPLNEPVFDVPVEQEFDETDPTQNIYKDAPPEANYTTVKIEFNVDDNGKELLLDAYSDGFIEALDAAGKMAEEEMGK